jgi:hypothetical protein
MSGTNWFSNCYRQGFKNLGNSPTISVFDARKLAKYWKDTGAEVVYMNAIFQSHVLFPTNLSEVDPFLPAGRDLVGEFCEACQRLGLRAGAYVTPFEHAPFTREHPEYCQTKTDGTHNDGPSWMAKPYYWACWNSPFLDKMCELLAECYSRYPLEAVFFDGLLSRQGVCHCPSCTQKFKADTGFALPGAHDMADPAFRAYRKWKMNTLTEACKRLVAASRVRNPNVQIVSNTPVAWCNWCAVQPEEFMDATEFTCVEIQPAATQTPGYVHFSSVELCDYLIAYTRGQCRNFPKVQAYDWVGHSSTNINIDVMLEMKTAIAQGGLPCIQGDQPVMKKAFGYIRKCEPYLADTQPVLWGAIAASQESSDTQRVQDACDGAYFEDIRGTFGVMFDLRRPVEFVSGRDLVEGLVRSYSVLMLSDMGYVNDKQAAVIREFVRNGGGLIATAETSLIGEDGKRLADFALADVLGVSLAELPSDWQQQKRDDWSPGEGFLFFKDKPWWGDSVQPSETPEAGDLYLKTKPWISSPNAYTLNSSFVPVELHKGANAAAWISARIPKATQAIPGIVEHRYGKGKVIYLAPRFGEIYARFPFPHWRRLFETALARVASRPAPIETDAPRSVSIYAWNQPAASRWVIHLINDLDESGRVRGRVYSEKNQSPDCVPRTRTIAIEDIEVTVRRPGISRVELPLEKKRLVVRKVRGGIRFTLKRLEQHALVVVS